MGSEMCIRDRPEIDPEGVFADHDDNLMMLERGATEAAQRLKASQRRDKRDEGASDAQAKGKRKAAPATGEPRAGVEKPQPSVIAFDIGEGAAVTHLGEESWGVIGQPLKLHNSFWGMDDDAYAACTVVGYVGEYQFEAARSRHTYVIEHEGHHYPIRHRAVAQALADPHVKQRVRGLPPPRLLSKRAHSGK